MSRFHAWAVSLDFDLACSDHLLKGLMIQVLVRDLPTLEGSEVKDLSPGQRHPYR